jgi:hypothetical protein
MRGQRAAITRNAQHVRQPVYFIEPNRVSAAQGPCQDHLSNRIPANNHAHRITPGADVQLSNSHRPRQKSAKDHEDGGSLPVVSHGTSAGVSAVVFCKRLGYEITRCVSEKACEVTGSGCTANERGRAHVTPVVIDFTGIG